MSWVTVTHHVAPCLGSSQGETRSKSCDLNVLHLTLQYCIIPQPLLHSALESIALNLLDCLKAKMVTGCEMHTSMTIIGHLLGPQLPHYPIITTECKYFSYHQPFNADICTQQVQDHDMDGGK
jgi:hypothetical protein